MENKITIDLRIVSLSVIVMLFAIVGFLTYQLYGKPTITGAASLGGCDAQTSAGQSDTGLGTSINTINVIPKGVPEIYGSELKVSFDDVASLNPQKADDTIYKLAVLDQQITLSGDDLDRYIKIVSNISCEYCCGAESIIFPDGQAACGCAHSFAMRGLAKYLIKNHGSEYTDNQILEEMGKWKTLFFPDQIGQKAKILQDKGIELNYINLASNKYRGIETGATGGMVGGC